MKQLKWDQALASNKHRFISMILSKELQINGLKKAEIV